MSIALDGKFYTQAYYGIKTITLENVYLQTSKRIRSHSSVHKLLHYALLDPSHVGPITAERLYTYRNYETTSILIDYMPTEAILKLKNNLHFINIVADPYLE